MVISICISAYKTPPDKNIHSALAVENKWNKERSNKVNKKWRKRKFSSNLIDGGVYMINELN